MSPNARHLRAELRRKLRGAYEAYVLNGIVEPRRVQRHLFFWARFVLKRRTPTIIGITGSVGKSTTTEAVSAFLTHEDAAAVVGKVWKTSNNMNNHDGLPLVVLGFDDFVKDPLSNLWLLLRLPFRAVRLAVSGEYPRILVLEYGSDRSGYIDRMVELAPPAIAVITAIGPAHIEGMGSMEGVVQEKAALLRGCPPPRLVVLGEDHDYIEQLVARTRSPLVRVPGRGIELAKGIAAALCTHLGVPESVRQASHGLKGPERRLQYLEAAGIRVIDDSYNANPLSMRLGLDTLLAESREGERRVAILGTMAELGDRSAEYHSEIGCYARSRADFVIGVGEFARHYEPNVLFPDSGACAAALDGLLGHGDHVLVKGSASVGMNKIVDRIKVRSISIDTHLNR